MQRFILLMTVWLAACSSQPTRQEPIREPTKRPTLAISTETPARVPTKANTPTLTNTPPLSQRRWVKLITGAWSLQMSSRVASSILLSGQPAGHTGVARLSLMSGIRRPTSSLAMVLSDSEPTIEVNFKTVAFIPAPAACYRRVQVLMIHCLVSRFNTATLKPVLKYRQAQGCGLRSGC